MICFITGGARSGKSAYAQAAALAISECPLYLATAVDMPEDPEFAQRIARHRQDRDQRWSCIEEPLEFSALDLDHRVVVIDCVTLWLSNLLEKHLQDADQALSDLQHQVDLLAERQGEFFIISNEIGMGVHASSALARKFTDLQGWANQYIAAKADRVIFMVSGIPLPVKGSPVQTS